MAWERRGGERGCGENLSQLADAAQEPDFRFTWAAAAAVSPSKFWHSGHERGNLRVVMGAAAAAAAATGRHRARTGEDTSAGVVGET